MVESITPLPLLELRNITREYPGVMALHNVNFNVCAGELHALVGENGAGKSTLCRIIAGVTRPNSGDMLFHGKPYAPSSRSEARNHGVAMVMQELNLISNLTVAENIFMDRMPTRGTLISYRDMNAAAHTCLQTLGLNDINPDQKVWALGVGQQQMIEIASALSRHCDILILDEPTAALTQRETEHLFAQITELKKKSVGIIYVSHRMEEIKRIADRITVLRDGEWVATSPAADVDMDQIIHWMVGRQLPEPCVRKTEKGTVALRVVNLTVEQAVNRVSFELHHGEILGFAGLMGSGRTETMRAVFGADRSDAGEIYLYGSSTPEQIRSPRDAVRRGIALLTEDRKQQGLFLPMSIRSNITMTRLQSVSTARTFIRENIEAEVAHQWCENLSVRCRDEEQTVGELSGGNQQKVVIAKWIFRDCDILIFDEPTRGIDIGARYEIYQLLDNLVKKGKAIIVVSSDMQELMAISDRIAVMSDGCLTAEFRRGEWTQEAIMEAALKELINREH
ncbi:MAG: sugar ABC transporter ATP-binding protein [Kiritimatiellae bacterium]|nr:sugar ABC transporter ATP-binding protein [Kiritimatiellia bacterium]MDD5519237.1 sugar ABC transporter ATP-binding protein [Kiritimatiellia bacterium]